MIDTGIDYTHDDLVGNVWINPNEVIGESSVHPDGCPGFCGVDDDQDGRESTASTEYDCEDDIDNDGDGLKDANDPGCSSKIDETPIYIQSGEDAAWDDDENGYVDDIHGYDFGANEAQGDHDPVDEYGNRHGTHVAGTIGAVANNGIGVAGVNHHCKLVALKTDGPSIQENFVSASIAAVDYVIANNIKVSNNSWKIEEYSQGLYDAILESQDIGHIFVAGARNEGANLDDVLLYPPSYDLENIISVAATDNNDCLADFELFGSNFGPNSVDLSAPGVDIYSTTFANIDPTSSDYDWNSGTSMASPHVAGVVALVMSQNPSMTWQQVKDRVLITVRRAHSLTGLTITGGVVNALAALGDCNENGVQDDLDISGGTSMDCDSNGMPDECDYYDDCNNNTIQDICDVASGTSVDCNDNQIPDSCELDSCGPAMPIACGEGDCCQDNPTRGCACTACYKAVCLYNPACCFDNWSTICASLATTFAVCACDPLITTPRNDCNENGILDECEPQGDCNGNNIQDICDIAFGTSNDCNCNSIPDDCDIASGFSADTNSNDIPDECDPITGACCTLDIGTPCTSSVTECSCTYNGGIFQGVSSSCTPQPKGACCLGGGTCQSNTYKCTCLALGGIFAGSGSKCIPYQCQQYFGGP